MQDRGGVVSVPAELRGDLQQAQGDLQQYLRNGNLTALDAAAAACSRILEHPQFTNSDVGFQLATCHGAAHVFTCRFNAYGDVADLDRALGLCRYAVEHAPADSPKLPTCWNNLGNVLRTCYGRTGRLEEMEEAIQAFQKAVESTPPDSVELPRHLNNLGTGLLDRHHQTGQLEDIEKAIRVFRQAVACTPQSSPDLPRHLSNLGSALSERYGHSGPLENLDEAIRICQQAVSLAPPGSPELPLYLTSLAARTALPLQTHGSVGGSGRNDSGLPAGGGEHAARLARVAQPSQQLGQRPSRPISAHRSVGGLGRSDPKSRQAIARTRPDSPHLPSRLNNLGVGLRDRYGRTGQLEDLEEAIQVWQQAIAGTPPDSPEPARPPQQPGHGSGAAMPARGGWRIWRKRFWHASRPSSAHRPDSPELPGYLSNLGIGLRYRYGCTGRLEDLEEAIRVCQQAVASTPPDSPELPACLNNLGGGLRDRYARTGRLEDLEEAIRVSQQAVASHAAGLARTAHPLNNLGIGLSDRYARTGRLEDLEEAIRVYQQAVARTPPDSPDLPEHLNNLGNGLSDRYARTGRLEDLEEAIRVYQQAVAMHAAGLARAAPTPQQPGQRPALPLCPHGSAGGPGGSDPGLPAGGRAHAAGLARTAPPPQQPGRRPARTAIARTGRLEDLEEAIRVCQQAVARTPPDSPELPSHLNNLGTGLSVRYGRTGRLEDLEEGATSLPAGLRVGARFEPRRRRILSGRSWGDWASRAIRWEEAVTAYQGVFAAVDRLLREQVLRTGKESWLREAQGLAGRRPMRWPATVVPKRPSWRLEQGRRDCWPRRWNTPAGTWNCSRNKAMRMLYRRFRDAAEAVQNLQQPDRAGDVPRRLRPAPSHPGGARSNWTPRSPPFADRRVRGFSGRPRLGTDPASCHARDAAGVPGHHSGRQPGADRAAEREATKMAQAPIVLIGASPIRAPSRPCGWTSSAKRTWTICWSSARTTRSRRLPAGAVGANAIGCRRAWTGSCRCSGEKLMGPLAAELRVRPDGPGGTGSGRR